VTDPGRKTRWANTTPEQRRAITAKATAARIREGNDRRIAELIASAPPLTEEQRARLARLLDSQPESGAA
jgi:plasmid maintenance system antidote protein VapI